jgi:hypothetical protein
MAICARREGERSRAFPGYRNVFPSVHPTRSLARAFPKVRPCFATCLLKTFQQFWRYTAAVVSDLERNLLIINLEVDFCRWTFRMTVDVSKSFL